jgi:hypothetical protein
LIRGGLRARLLPTFLEDSQARLRRPAGEVHLAESFDVYAQFTILPLYNYLKCKAYISMVLVTVVSLQHENKKQINQCVNGKFLLADSSP